MDVVMLLRGWRLGPALLLVLLAGCAAGKAVTSTSWLDRLRPFRGPAGADVVRLDVAVIERPLDDAYLRQNLWLKIDEQCVSLERKAVLEENGFRVGQFSGITPAELQRLLTSEKSCINPRAILLHAGKPTTLPIGPAAAVCRFQLPQGEKPTPVVLEQAECLLNVVPTLTNDGKTRLQFTPEVRHGQKTLMAKAIADGTSLFLGAERPLNSYPALAWDVALNANEYVVVGACCDRPDSLGYQYFQRHDEPVPVQRLLVIRTHRTAPEPGTETAVDDSAATRTPPLALQAAWTNARGRGEP
jgi:hypothetical protein